MSLFAAAAGKLSAAADRAYGEVVRIVPMQASPFGAPIADATREAREVIAVVTVKSDRLKPIGSTMGRDLDPQLVTAPTCVSFDNSGLMVDGSLVLPQKPDRILCLERDGMPAFELTTCEPDGLARHKSVLVAVL